MKQKLKFGILLLGAMILTGCLQNGESHEVTNMNIETNLSETVGQEKEESVLPVETVREDAQVLISLAGDCSLGKLSIHSYERTFHEFFDKYGAEYFLKNVKNIFEADDLTLVNLEGVLTYSEDIQEKEYNIKGKPEFKDVLVAGSVEAVSFGNNHRIDYGQQGVDDTIAALNEINVIYAYDENLGIYETESGIKIGFVSVNEVYDKELVEVYLEKGIDKLKETTDLVLACCHWGNESENYPQEYQIELARKCIDWGADLVVGCHAHVLQGIDYYNGKYILYGLGNFCFGGNKNPKVKDTMIVQTIANFDANGLVGDLQLKIIPCSISSKEESNDYCPTIVEGKNREKIIQLLNKYSADFPVFVMDDGTVVHE